MLKAILAVTVAWATGLLLVAVILGPRLAVAQQGAAAQPVQVDALPSWAAPLAGFVGYMLWEAWLGATKRVAAGSTLGLIVNIIKAIVGAAMRNASKSDPPAKS